MLVEAAPGRFFVPPYVGHRSWPGVYLDVPIDRDEIRAIVEGAYRAIAPRRLVARLDEAGPEPRLCLQDERADDQVVDRLLPRAQTDHERADDGGDQAERNR
jgi:hypothetical protein